MTWERALEADARLAAKNSVLIRAAIRQSFNAERAYQGYLATNPDLTLSLPQQRSRARAWAMINLRINLEPLKEVMLKVWSDAVQLGNLAAQEEIDNAKAKAKADTTSVVDWSKWKPGDEPASTWASNPGILRLLLQSQGITWKGFSDTTIQDIGNAVGEAIKLGLSAKVSAKNIMNHVANPARALTIAITEQNRAISMATQQRYKDAGLEKMEWLVFEPCKICAQNADVVVEIGKPFPSGDTRPPAHPNCRCALGPVIPGFNDRPVIVNDQPIESAPTAGVMITPQTQGARESATIVSANEKVKAKHTSVEDWDREELRKISEIKDLIAEETQIWNGATQQYEKTWRQPQDVRLKAILEAQGFTAKPQVVDGTQMYLLGEKNPRMWRGVTPTPNLSAAQMIEQFKTGDMFVGTGVIGNGVYSGNNYNYVLKYAQDKSENVMALVFKPGARFVDYKVADEGANQLSQAFYHKAFGRKADLEKSVYRDFVESFGDLTESEARELGWMFHDPGAWAAAHGYDAISNIDSKTKEAVYVILNRGAVAIEK